MAERAPSGELAAGDGESVRRLRALLRAPARADALVWATVPAPVGAPERLLELAAGERAAAFLPADGGGLAAIGLAAAASARGTDRLRKLATEARALGARFEVRGDGPGPRLVGGAAFADGAAAGPWSQLGEATLWCARWTYVVTGGRGWLAACVGGAALEVERDVLETELARLLDGLRAEPLAMDRRPPRGVATLEPSAVIEERVRSALHAIECGEAEKLVVATHARVRGLADVTDVDVLGRLAARSPGVRFLFRAGGVSFVGGSPERLVARDGNRIAADALAGSVPPALADTLLASDKDRREHALVVEHLTAGLAAAGVAVTPPGAPGLRILPTVAHLHTPIEGTLARPIHVLDLAAALHPTPAVAGTPPAAAAAWLARTEPLARGWYAGPVGWVTPDGDGELVVALRSGLLVGDGALCLAGAGIVRGSEPAREREEMALKLRVMLDALGAG